MSKLEAALAAARKGFRVFPLIPNGKTPALAGDWRIWATRDEAKIREHWTRNPNHNIGMQMQAEDGSDFGTVDVDPRNGGEETFRQLAKDIGHEEERRTLLSATAGGGNHVIYKLPPGIHLRGGTNRFGAGVDLKTGAGHYIVGPGSTIDGNEYRWINDRPIALMPPPLIERAQKAAQERSANAGKRLVDEDDWAVGRAERYVRDEAPIVHDGEGRDDWGAQVGRRIYDFGVSESTARILLHEWNQTKCIPPKEDEAVDRWARSAARNRQKPIGDAHPDNPEKAKGFEPVMTGSNPVRPDKFYFIRADESAKRALAKPREWLVEGLIHRHAEAVLIGAPGGGKTFVALDMAYRIATATPFAGHETFGGPVVYIAAEAQEGIHTRLAALGAHYGALGDAPLYVIPVAPDLAHGLGDAKELVAAIERIAQLAGKPVELFIVDTLNRAMSGGDENSSKDMGAVLNAVRSIRAATNAASLVIHHPGWDSNRARGHSSVFGAVDTEMQLKNNLLSVTKLRDAPAGTEVAFKLKPIEIGEDPNGNPVTSCYVVAGSLEQIRIQPDGEQAAVLELVRKLRADGKKITTKAVWELSKAVKNGMTGFSSDEAIRSHLRRLVIGQWLEKGKHGQYLIREPVNRSKPVNPSG